MPQTQLDLDIDEPPRAFFPAAFLTEEGPHLQLKAIEVDGLKGFDNTRIELCPLSVLTGPNNSGKSTVLQAIALAFECIRRSIDYDRWTLKKTGSSVGEFGFLPVNHPKDLWYKTIWKPSADRERYIKVKLLFSNDLVITARIRYLFGALNVGLEVTEPVSSSIVKQLARAIPIYILSTQGPVSHEDRLSLAHIHMLLNMRETNKIIRNILLELQINEKLEELSYIQSVVKRYFSIDLDSITYDAKYDLEIRAPIEQEDFKLDLISEGSGFNQILLLATVVVWSKPRIVLLDEPDAHLHSSVQSQLLEFLTELVEKNNVQIILATHSKDLIGQTPLEFIIPIDRSRRINKPLESIDHLLLEYKRQGTISNVDLALLYQTKRCIFVEGETDDAILHKIAERLKIGIFQGRNQAVVFGFGGIDKSSYLPSIVQLFERLVGERLHWGLIQDSHSNIPEIKARNAQKARDSGVPLFHQWSEHSIENYLIKPFILKEAISRKKPELGITDAQIEELLSTAIGKIQDEEERDFIDSTRVAFRKYEIDEDPTLTAVRYKNTLDTLEKKLKAFSGKRVYGRFVDELQGRFGVNLRIDDIINILDERNFPTEIKSCLEEFNVFFRA
jgi:ABC-type cobalamin/Fe3+-siderophores transport system ATPase subunit